MTSRLSADCQKVSDQVQLNVNVFLRSVIQVFFTLAFMVYINLRLALACFVVVPAIAMITEISRYMRVFTKDASRRWPMPMALQQRSLRRYLP